MAAMAQAARRATIVFADDEPKLCSIVSRILEEEGYHVVTAANGCDALEVVTRIHPEVVVLDINMPGMDGIALLRALRRQGLDCPVIMLTAQGTIETAREAMALGAYDYMTKPFDLRLFKETLQSALAGGDG